MDVADFDFHLPSELIAQEAPERGTSRLLVLHRQTGRVEHTSFARLGDYLAPDDLLVLNDTKVFPARLLGQRVPSGGAVECLLVGRTTEGAWTALVHPGQKLKPGARFACSRNGVTVHGEILGRHFNGRRTVTLWTDADMPLDAAIDRVGHIPLPPYIHREDRDSDRERYQTVFAAHRGSIAAPTAGLHFTPDLLDALGRRGIRTTTITLHVGYGTFKPVRVDRVEDHAVDPEAFTVTEEAAAALTTALASKRRIVAVGTTTVRTLESLSVSPEGRVAPGSGETSLFIHPGHQFTLVHGLVTNFHLPRSSLLMLVAAFAGREQVLAAYREAVEQGYRFYSYGDAMLIV